MFETLDKHDQLSLEIRTDPQTNTWLLTINIQTAVIGFICVRIRNWVSQTSMLLNKLIKTSTCMPEPQLQTKDFLRRNMEHLSVKQFKRKTKRDKIFSLPFNRGIIFIRQPTRHDLQKNNRTRNFIEPK